jgi:hypothetical protein
VSFLQIHKGVGATLQGADKVAKGLKKADAFVGKSLNTAVRVEGYRLKKLLQAQIRSGAPGGRRFAPLSYIARRLHGRSPNRNPLKRLALGIRYHVVQKPFAMAIGWVGPQTGFDARMAMAGDPFSRGIAEGHHVSKSWRRIAFLQQQGFTRRISRAQRDLIIGKGASLLKNKTAMGNTPFFLRKSTKTFKTPERQIISPFWQSQQAHANSNIKQNFRKKLKGLRI